MNDQSPKDCPRCGTQGAAIDSRQSDGFVRRRYRCRTEACGAQWTTAEFLVNEGDMRIGTFKVKQFWERQAQKSVLKMLDDLRAEVANKSYAVQVCGESR